MTCPTCGRWAPADHETGYDIDDLCPFCKENEMNPTVDNADVSNPVPVGWTHASEDLRRGGIVYSYPKGVLPDGQTEFHLTREALHRYVFPNRD